MPLSRSRDGIRDLLDIETARATVDSVTDLHADLEDGLGVSGPAARRAILASASAPQYAGAVITLRTARQILDNPDLAVYDNPNALLMCVYNQDRALCQHGAARDAPSLDRCVPSCANIACTDQHAALLRARADDLDTRARRVPGPMADRFKRNAVRLRHLAEQHDRTRLTLEEDAS